MNYLKLTILLIAICIGNVKGQNVAQLSVSDITIERKDSLINLDFTVTPKEMEIKSISQLAITPEIVSADSLHSVSLPPVVVAGRNRWLIWKRTSEEKRPATLLRAGKTNPYRYHATVAYEDWMEHSTVNFREDVTGCNSCPQINEVIPVAILDYEPVKEIPYDIASNYVQPKASAAKVRQIEGQAYVDFPVNKIEIFPKYRSNSKELAKILASIDTVKNDPDCTVSALALKGYASPEGSYANNTRLAKGRTQTLRDYVMSFYDFPASIVTTSYEPEDWNGLRKWVEASEIDNKSGILAIIDSDLAPDAKDLKIKQTYPTQYAYLLQEVYPGLRHSDYKIEYVIRTFTNPDEIRELVKTAPQKLSLEEFFTAANACDPQSEEYYEIFETAVRMYPTDETANINAANSAIARGDYKKAAQYLDRAGNSSHADRLRALLKEMVEAQENVKTHVPVTFIGAE